MKKVLSVFLALSIILTLFALLQNMSASALYSDWYSSPGWIWQYELHDGNATIIGCYDDPAYFYDFGREPSPIIFVPSVLGGYPVTSITDMCSGKFEHLYIPDSVTSIGNSAFAECDNLTSISIPNSVTSIGDHAFSFCTSLNKIKVAENNPSYTDLDGVLYTKDYATLIAYPARKIQTSYTIPDGVISIKEGAFLKCSSLAGTITIPESVINIDSGAFGYCTSLSEITVAANNPSYTDLDGVLYTKDYATLISYPSGKTQTSFAIPRDVTNIEFRAFRNCSNLASITIPDSVVRIFYGEFSDCPLLTIYGRKGSYAQTYANSNSIPFVCTGHFITQSVKGNPGQTVDVTVSIDNNPGIIAAKLNINYDSNKINLVGINNGEIFGAGTFFPGNNLNLLPYSILWEDGLAPANNTTDGTLVTLTFEIDENAEVGAVPVTITYDQSSTFDFDLNDAEFDIVSGSVEITNNVPGDANKDGSIDLKDIVLIRRWIAGGFNAVICEANSDVNGDSVVDLKDVAILRRYLSGGWDVELVYSDILYA